MVELLIDAGADLAARNSEGLTPLMKFALSIDNMCEISTLDPRLEVLKMVLDRDDNIYAIDKKFRTALHVLVSNVALNPFGSLPYVRQSLSQALLSVIARISVATRRFVPSHRI